MSLKPFRQMTDTGAALAAVALVVDQGRGPLANALDRAVAGLRADQDEDGYWCYEFEADATIPSEYIMMMHFMDEIDEALEARIAVYLRDHQEEHGGWSLYPGGELDLSATVKAYFALKLVGDDPMEPHMVRAREAVLARGGAARANVFTHVALALFGQIPWRGVPFIPVEIVLLPRWFPFHLSKVSYWSRAVMVPLFILCTLKPRAANPRGVDIGELFVVPAQEERHYFEVRSGLNRAFLWLDRLGRLVEPLVPRFIRRRAMARAEAWIVERLNGNDGLGAIFPAMVNAHEVLPLLGYPPEHPYRLASRESLRRLVVEKGDHAYCQPCVSPVWDTGLACLAILEAVGDENDPAVRRGLEWLQHRQLLDHPGDWQHSRPKLRGGGWPFQFGNGHYPDIDDTPVVGWAMLRTRDGRYAYNVERAAEWICGMQSSNGGWASFEVDNTHYYLNEIPFADHGALLDPPTSDVTARCVAFLAQFDPDRYHREIERGVAFLRAEQESHGGWYGRWGTNYIYGTWSALVGLEAVGEPADSPAVRRAVEWLESVQREDGGWGEDNWSYHDPTTAGRANRSTSFQSAWAILGLLAAGERRSVAVERGVRFLLSRQGADGLWYDPEFTAPGFPRVFYLKYHGYTRYFPLWALARYRNLTEGPAGGAARN